MLKIQKDATQPENAVEEQNPRGILIVRHRGLFFQEMENEQEN